MLSVFKDKLLSNKQIVLSIKAVVNQAQTEIREVMINGTIKIALKANREKGRANQELVRFLSNEFEVSVQDIKIISGQTASLKKVKIIV